MNNISGFRSATGKHRYRLRINEHRLSFYNWTRFAGRVRYFGGLQ
jgi:hypothetical protein